MCWHTGWKWVRCEWPSRPGREPSTSRRPHPAEGEGPGHHEAVSGSSVLPNRFKIVSQSLTYSSSRPASHRVSARSEYHSVASPGCSSKGSDRSSILRA